MKEGKGSNFGRWIESQARVLRIKAGIGPFDRLDPIDLSQKMGVRIESLAAFQYLPGDLVESVLSIHGECWDAGTLQFPEGEVLVIYNPKREARRRNATLMEELAHIHLGHKPSAFITVEGIVLRSVNGSNETQAYSVGSAALLPAYVLKGARTRGYSREILADQHQVSIELVTYREKVTGIRLSNGEPVL